MVYEGVNNIGTRLIAAIEQMITRMQAFGIPVFRCTSQTYTNAERDRTHQNVNAWIRSSGRFDGVVDFDAAVWNSSQPDMLRTEYDSATICT
ncbi:Uu.00g040330.m01.CDS01 [Anthostomella pinea]|uniref:Uu.00g040330.m01.CDS01 n=1 Tax=Anthostomella pinea TaxID=933095 RepID=A0AAI8YDX0_9PEZI|nr:Uu.00g040330.m01.CDS01 [Anthostomella pinea]